MQKNNNNNTQNKCYIKVNPRQVSVIRLWHCLKFATIKLALAFSCNAKTATVDAKSTFFYQVTIVPLSKTNLDVCYEVLEHVLIICESPLNTIFNSMMLAPSLEHTTVRCSRAQSAPCGDLTIFRSK